MAGFGFKIVAFLKKRHNSLVMEYAYIPHAWELNGIVFWPKNNLERLRKDKLSSPQSDWLKYKCTVKKNHINDVQEAQLWEDEYINATDTDSEQRIQIQIPPTEKDGECDHSNTYEKLFKVANTTKVNSNSKITNSICEQISQVQLSSKQDKPISDYNNTYENSFEITNDNEVVGTEIINLDFEIENCQVVNATDNTSSIIPEISKFKEEVAALKFENKALKNLLETQSVKSEIKELTLTVAKIYEMIKQKNSQSESSTSVASNNLIEDTNFEEMFSFPISEPQNLYLFDCELKQKQQYMQYVINRFSKVGGTDGNECGFKVGKTIISLLFGKLLMTQYSWTGISRTSGLEKKLPFQVNSGILKLFNIILKKADSRWSDLSTEKLFKEKTLKHSKQINEAFEKNKKKKFDLSINSSSALNYSNDNNLTVFEDLFVDNINCLITADNTENGNITTETE